MVGADILGEELMSQGEGSTSPNLQSLQPLPNNTLSPQVLTEPTVQISAILWDP